MLLDFGEFGFAKFLGPLLPEFHFILRITNLQIEVRYFTKKEDLLFMNKRLVFFASFTRL